MHRLAVVLLCVLSGCAVQLERADVCLRKKLEIVIPLDNEKFTPRRCHSKEVFNRIFN